MIRRSPIRALRQHHGIEHATITLLSRRTPDSQLVARSDLQGFIVYGEVATEALHDAATEAISLLQAGKSDLATHANCGTNLVTAGVLSGLAAVFAGSGRRRSSMWDRVPSAVLGATLALLVAPPLGRWAQETITTTAEVDGLHIAGVTRLQDGPVARHRVTIGER